MSRDEMTKSILGLVLVFGMVFLPLFGADASAQPPNQGSEDRPQLLNAWLSRADGLIQRNQDRAAIRLLGRAQARFEDHPEVALRLSELTVPRDALGAHRMAASELAQARHWLEVLSQEDSDQRRPRMEVGWLLAVTGDSSSASDALFRIARPQDPEVANVLVEASALCVRREDYRCADLALERARRFNPTERGLLLDHASVRLVRGLAEDALLLLERFLEHDPEHLGGRRLIASAHQLGGQPGRACALYRSIAEEHPQDARAQLDLARAALAAEHRTTATAAAERALSLDLSNGEGARILGALRLRGGDRQGARSAYEEALRRNPNDALARSALDSLAGESPSTMGR